MTKSIQPSRSRYFIALVPDQPIYEEIDGFKRDMMERFNTKAALRSPPHITLHMPFLLTSGKESAIKATLDDLGSKLESFDIRLDGFGCFEPRVIFVNVLLTEALKELKNHVDRIMKEVFSIVNPNYKHLPFHPHMTIAFRDLKKAQFHEAWSEFRSRPYHTTFKCRSVCLLRHNGKFWEIIHESHFDKAKS